jgi:transcriptional regulator with XRE-family HTH domain
MQAISHILPDDPYNPSMPGGRPTNKQASPLGASIAQARQHAGLSQNDLAQKLGISRNVIAQWERSAVAIKAEQLLALADTLGVTVDVLLGRSEPNKRGTGPVGKLRQVFERASKLPRSQQAKVAEFVDAFVAQHGSEKAS